MDILYEFLFLSSLDFACISLFCLRYHWLLKERTELYEAALWKKGEECVCRLSGACPYGVLFLPFFRLLLSAEMEGGE